MGRGPRVFENERGEGMAAGRPSKYDEKYCEQAYKLCLLGATDAELADFFNVNEDTINVWKKTYKEFSESLKRGKAEADATVAEKLYKRATGYSCKATKFATYEGEITDREEYIEHYPPDTTAAIFWLKNRQKDKWRDKQDVEHSGEIKMPNITIGK
jgi:transposase-like protein